MSEASRIEAEREIAWSIHQMARRVYWGDKRDRLRRVLWSTQGGVCGLCGVTMLPFKSCDSLDGDGATIDHVIPRSKGGPDRLGNMLVAHARCNSDKDVRVPTGCELVWLLAVNARLGVEPMRW